MLTRAAYQVGNDSDTRANEQEITELCTGVDLAAVQVEEAVQDDGGQHNCKSRGTKHAGTGHKECGFGAADVCCSVHTTML